jgi:elongation factor G
MDVEVVTPEEYVGTVMGDLSSRRGMIQGQDKRGNGAVVRAKVPLSEMFGYTTDLRSNTQGRAQSSMQFASYEKVPEGVAKKIIDERSCWKNQKNGWRVKFIYNFNEKKPCMYLQGFFV